MQTLENEDKKLFFVFNDTMDVKSCASSWQ